MSPDRDDYYAQVTAAFDRAAANYDAEYATNPIMAWLEDDTFARLCALFPRGSRLLEIGCGTGQMARRLAEVGYSIVATDISPSMIAQAEQAARGSQAAERLAWLAAPAATLEKSMGDEPGTFAGAYSNFGPLNCEPNLAEVAETLARLVTPRGAFLCSIMGRWCAWELGWGLLRLRPDEATRRWGHGWVQARMSGGPDEPPSQLPVRYYTPAEFAATFRSHFTVELIAAYPLVLPPPYLAGRFPGAPARLARLERHLSSLPGLRNLGDHFLMVLRRNGEIPTTACPVGQTREVAATKEAGASND